MSVWSRENECTLCHEKCEGEARQREHEKSSKHGKKVMVDIYFKEFGDGSRFVDEASNLVKRYRISGDRHLGLDWIHELHLPFSNDTLWACSICNESGANYEEADGHLFSLEHIRNHVNENDIENDVLPSDDKYTAYEKLLALRNEIIQKQSENGEEMAKPEVVKLSLQKSDIFKRLGLTEEASALFEIKKIPDMPKFAILQCDVCYQLLPVSAGKKVVIAQIYSAHECTDDHRRYNLMKGVLNQFEPRDIEDEELTNSKKPYTWREANGVYYGPMCGTMYLVVTDTEQFCTLCCCIVEKVEEHFTSEKHIAAYLALEQPIGVYRLLQLSERTRREQLLRLCNTSNLRNGKCMQIKCPRLPTLLKFLALPEAHRLPTVMPELIDQGDGDYGLKCMQCTTMLKVPAQELEGGARIWNSHIESEMHIAAAVTCSRRRFLDRFYVPAISTFKLDKTELHGKWEKQSIGQGANCMEIYTQTQCDVGLECIVDDLEREEISCMLCTRTFKKTTPEAATVINRHLRSFMHVYRYFYFTNPQLCSIFTEQESDAASQEFLLDCLRREPPRPNHLIRLYSPDLCLELDDLPRVPFDMIKSEPTAETENEIENGEKKEGAEDGNVQVETVMVSLRDAFQGLNIRLIDVSRDSKKTISKILCRCLECNLAFVLHKDRLKEDLYDNHINTAEHRRRKEEYQANQFAPKDFMEEFSGHTVKPYPQQKEDKAVWLPNGQYVLSVVGLEYIVEKRIEVPQENPPEMPPEGGEREPEPAEKIVNFYCKCCCVNFPLKSFHLENHVRSYEHIINYLNVNSPQTLWELDMIRGIFRGVDGKKADEEVKKAIVTFVKDLKPPATYCIAVYDPAGVMHLKKEDAWKKAQARQREAHQESERKKATEERIKKDKERQELKAQIYEEKVKKMTEAAEQKKKIDERLKAIKEQQEMELEKRRQEKAKRDEQERKLDALNRIIEEDAAKKSKLVRSQDPEAEAKRNMAHYRMQDVKKQLEAKKGILLKDSKEATIDEPKLVIPAKLTESMQLKNAQQSRLQAELDMQQKSLAASSAVVPNLSQPPPSLPPTSLPPPTVVQLPITSMPPPPSIAPAALVPQMNQINRPPPFQTPIWGMPQQQQQPVGINFGVPPPTQPQLVQPQLAQPVVQQIQAGMQQFVQPALVQPTLAQPVVPQVQSQHQNLSAPGILAPHQLLRMGNPGPFGFAPTSAPLQQPSVPASGFNVPPPGWGLAQSVVSSASLSFQPVPPPVSAATLSSLPSTSQAQPPQQRQELHFDPKPHFSNYVPKIERIPQYPTKDEDGVPMSESDDNDDSVKSASPSPSRNKEEPEEKVIGRPDIAPEVMWPVKRISLSMRKPDPAIMTLKNRTELEKMLLKNGFEKTPTGELPMQFNKKALKTKGAVGIENLYEIVCVDLPELDTMYCVECRVWDTFQNMIEHLASEDHQLTFLLKNHRYLHDQVTREDNAAMKRVTLQQFCQTIQQQTRQETVSQRFRTLIDKAVIVKYCPEFTDNVAYEWLGYATPRVDRSALFGKSPSRHSRKRSSSRSPSRTSKRRRRSRSRSPYGRSRRSRSRTRSRSRERRSRSRSPRRSYRRRSRSSSRSRDRGSRKDRDRDADRERDRKKASVPASAPAPVPAAPSIMTAPQGTAADVKFPPTGLGALGDGRWDSSSNKFIPASSVPTKTITAGLQDPRLSMRAAASPQKPASDPLASFAANIANLRNFATNPAAGTGQMEQASQISQQPIQQVQPAQQQQPMQQVQQMAGRNMPSQQSGRTDRVERDRDERGRDRDREDRGRNRDRDREHRDKDDRYRQTTSSMQQQQQQQQQSSSQIQPQQAPQIRQEASAPITQATQQSHPQPQQQQYPGSSSLSESIAQVQKKMAEEKSVRLRKLLGLTVAIDQERTKGYVINPERLIQMFREFGVAPTTIGVATVDDLMRFLNDELRSLQGVQPVHPAAQQQIPQINLQQFGISVAPTQTAPSFPAPYNSQGVYRQVQQQQQQMPSSSANVSNMSNVSTYQQLPSTSNSSQLYTASMGGGSTANTYMGSTQHTQQQQFHQQTHQQPQMQTYQQQSSYSQYRQQQQQPTQSMQSMPQQGGSYQATMSNSYVHPQQIHQTHQQGHSQVHLPSALVVPEKPKSPILKPNPYVFTHTEDIYSGPAYRSIVYPGKNADGEQDDDWDDLEAFMTGRK